MAHLKLDVEQYDKLLGLLYDAAKDDISWGQPLEMLRKIFAANYVTLILSKPSQDDQNDLGLMIAVGADIEGNGTVQYLPYQPRLTPFANRPADTVLTVDDLMSEEEWRNSNYLKHWCAKNDVYHVMSVDITTENSGKLRFRITRPESAPNFSKEDKAFCELILPHIRRALNIHNQIDHGQSIGTMYSQAIGRLSIATVMIDEQGQILDQNLFARQILESGDGLKIVGGRLEAYYPSDNKALRALIKNAFANFESGQAPGLPEAMSITRPSGEVNLGLVIEVIPSSGWAEGEGKSTAVVYIRDSVGKSQASTDIAKKLFGLTPAETALSLQLTNGLSLEEAAEALNIRRNTARAHLRSIFSKTGVRRQTELVRIFLNSVAALGCSPPEDDLSD